MDQATDPNKPKHSPNFVRYSGLGLQMMLTIGVAAWIGTKADRYFSFKFPVFLLSLVFLAFGGCLYQLYRIINKN